MESRVVRMFAARRVASRIVLHAKPSRLAVEQGGIETDPAQTQDRERTTATSRTATQRVGWLIGSIRAIR
jgi:hypothetical protein